MPKNVNISVTQELSEKMDKFDEVNWSAVARDSFESYIKARTSEGLEAALLQIKAKRGEDYKRGYEFLIANVAKVELTDLEEMAKPIDLEFAPESIENHYFTVREIFHLDDLTCDGKDLKFSTSFIDGIVGAAKQLLREA